MKKWLYAPIEFMIPNNPGVVLKIIEEIDHEFAFAAQTDVGPLINITDVDQNRVAISPSPLVDLRDAPCQPSHSRSSLIVQGRQNVTVQIGCVQNGNRNCVGIEPCRGACEIRNCADQSRLTSHLQEMATGPGSIRIRHDNFQLLGMLASCRARLNQNAQPDTPPCLRRSKTADENQCHSERSTAKSKNPADLP